jgi:CheY-like chemotaxis protein
LLDLFSDILSFNNKTKRSVLVVEDNELESSQIVKMLEADNIEVVIADTGEKAFHLLNSREFDCITLDYTLPDISGTDLVKKVDEHKKKLTPVIVYSAKEFSKNELKILNNNSNTILLKGVNSLEHLLEEVVLQLHINHQELAPEKKKIVENIRRKEDILTGKNILVVDDDVRNLFALTTVFERFNINVITAESGKEAIHQLMSGSQRIDMVLMDIMMPEMDGYETTQKIRREHAGNGWI